MPDLTTLGKIIGGGLPVGAFGGRRRTHGDRRAARLDLPGRHAVGEPAGDGRRGGDAERARRAGRRTSGSRRSPTASPRRCATRPTKGERPVTLNQVGAMMTMFFCEGPVESFADARRADTAAFAAYHRHMLERGVYLAPSQFESAMVSLALTDADLEMRRRRGGGVLRRRAEGVTVREGEKRHVPTVTVPRLALYLRKLRELEARGVVRVSSKDLAAMIDLNAAQIRKDFSYFGEFGTRGVGYEVVAARSPRSRAPRPRAHLERRHRRRGPAGDGAGALPRLRRAGVPAGRRCSTPRRRRSARSFGEGAVQRRRRSSRSSAPRARRHRPGHGAGSRGAGDRRPARAAAGVRAILNFAPVKVAAPADVTVRQVDLSSELMFLSFCLAAAGGAGVDGAVTRPPSRRVCARPRRRSPPPRRGRGRSSLRWGPFFAALDGARRRRLSSRPSNSSTRAICCTTARAGRAIAGGRRSRRALLAGDDFYARGLRLIAARGDVASVRAADAAHVGLFVSAQPERRRSPPTTLCGRSRWRAGAAARPACRRPRRRRFFDEVDADLATGAPADVPRRAAAAAAALRPARSGACSTRSSPAPMRSAGPARRQ